MGAVGALLAAVLGFGLHVNLSPSAPRGLYRTVAEPPARGAWVVACVGPDAAALACARGYLRPGPCPGGVQPVLKPVEAGAGDVVELERGVAVSVSDVTVAVVIVNGEHLPARPSAVVDSIGHHTAARGLATLRGRRRRGLGREHPGAQQLG